jgi:predicted pyridoxine 5'-phosphate oxidase superfamily flavin-nucleotide-binding protein
MGAKLTADMKRVVVEQRLAFVATVCPDGTPNLSPKGTISVWDDDHLVFADIRSPGTITMRLCGSRVGSGCACALWFASWGHF